MGWGNDNHVAEWKGVRRGKKRVHFQGRTCTHRGCRTIMNPEPTGSHGWHTGFCCVYMVLVVGFGDKANGQRDSIRENTEMESMG